MEFLFRFAYPFILYIVLPAIVLLAYVSLRWKKQVRYRFSLATELKQKGFARKHPYKKIFFLLRLCSLIGLAFLIARPQLIDPESKLNVQGVNIVIALDISGSMRNQYTANSRASRISVAKKEAIRFINKRDNDAVGLVLFGNDVISRCPLTADKNILTSIIKNVQIGLLDPNGTVLAGGLLASINRLRNAKGTKIIILLSDGVPSQNDIDSSVPIEAAQQLGIKVYTIGIGNEEDQKYINFYGLATQEKLATELLDHIAKETGGKSFLATKPHELATIYDTIDSLEKTDQEVPVFTHYHDIFMMVLWIIFGLIALEIILSSVIWFSI